MTWIVKDLKALVKYLCARATTYGPVGDEKIVFERLSDDSRLNVSRRSDVSARHVFQPMTHYYLRFADGPNADPSFRDFDSRPRVVVGLRPCDVQGLGVHDRVFGESKSYRALRDATVMVGYLCQRREPTCFCDSMGGDPLSREGMDVVTYPASDGYAIVAETEKGRKLLEAAPFRRLDAAPEPSFEDADHPVIDTSGLVESAACHDAPDSEIWNEIAFPCVACRVCTYVCPTCHCFTVTDEAFATRAGRAVVWDSCQNESFTKEASGHNPRAAKAARARQRLLHKFSYYPTIYQDLMCSGCGRCISGCPTGRNLVEELELLKTRAGTDRPVEDTPASDDRSTGGGDGARVAEGVSGS
jgi:ferredoxin